MGYTGIYLQYFTIIKEVIKGPHFAGQTKKTRNIIKIQMTSIKYTMFIWFEIKIYNENGS